MGELHTRNNCCDGWSAGKTVRRYVTCLPRRKQNILIGLIKQENKTEGQKIAGIYVNSVACSPIAIILAKHKFPNESNPQKLWYFNTCSAWGICGSYLASKCSRSQWSPKRNFIRHWRLGKSQARDFRKSSKANVCSGSEYR